MRRTVLTATLVVALTGCSSGDQAPGTGAATTEPTDPVSESPSATPATPLEGTWITDLKRKAVVAYIREAGWDKRAERALVSEDIAGPAETEFRIDFIGDQFRMSQAATDEQYQSGTFTIEEGRLILDDEAPVGEITFRLDIQDDTVTFDQPDLDGRNAEPNFRPGVPGWAPAAALWCSTTWERVDG